MRFQYHLLLCAGISALYFFFLRGSPAGVAVIFLSGFLIDADHLLSYQLAKGDLLKGNPLRKTHDFYSGRARRSNFLLFHFLEFGISCALIVKIFLPQMLTPFILGWGFHFLSDLAYFIYVTARFRPKDDPVRTFLSRYVLLYRALIVRKLLVD